MCSHGHQSHLAGEDSGPWSQTVKSLMDVTFTKSHNERESKQTRAALVQRSEGIPINSAWFDFVKEMNTFLERPLSAAWGQNAKRSPWVNGSLFHATIYNTLWSLLLHLSARIWTFHSICSDPIISLTNHMWPWLSNDTVLDPIFWQLPNFSHSPLPSLDRR